MILLSESPDSSSRDESAQSILRSIRRGGRPGPPASCSRHEQPPDTSYCFGASSRVESPTSLPLPPSLRPSACCGSDANTHSAFLHRTAPLLVLLPPEIGRASCRERV